MAARLLHALIVEDDFLFAWRLEDILRGLGFNSFAITSTIAEALAAAAEQRPDLITADLRLSDGSGLEAVQAIHAAIDPSIPVVFITADAEELTGMADVTVIGKPISAAALKRACGTVLPDFASTSAGAVLLA
jgi:CheY-like chemotaxis protein